MTNLEQALINLKNELKFYESDTFSASNEGLSEDPELLSDVLALMIRDTLFNACGESIRDYVYQARINKDPNWGSQEF